MVEYMPGEIWIGGKIAAALVPDLCTAISRQGVTLEWGNRDFEPRTAKDLVEAARPNERGVRLLRLCHHRARRGRFAMLERFLEKHHIAYTRFSAGQQHYDHEKVEFRPNTDRARKASDNQGYPVGAGSHAKTLRSAFAGMAEFSDPGSNKTATRSVQAARRPLQKSFPGEMPPLEPFEIVAGLHNSQLGCTPEEAPF